MKHFSKRLDKAVKKCDYNFLTDASDEELARDALNEAVDVNPYETQDRTLIIEKMLKDGWVEEEIATYTNPQFPDSFIDANTEIITYYPTGVRPSYIPGEADGREMYIMNLRDYLNLFSTKKATEAQDDAETFFILAKETETKGDPFIEYRYLDEDEARNQFFEAKFPVVLVAKGSDNLYQIKAMSEMTDDDKALIEEQVALLNQRDEASTESATEAFGYNDGYAQGLAMNKDGATKEQAEDYLSVNYLNAMAEDNYERGFWKGFTEPLKATEDTVKLPNGKWTNRRKGGDENHGEFDTKKEADKQRAAMFANGYKG